MFKYINHDEYKTLDDVCILITDGTHNPPKFVESGIPFILVSNITGNIVTYETPKYITENDYRVLMKRTPIEKGDVLLSTVGSYGHPAIVTEDRPFAFQRHIAHLKPNRDLLTSEYLHAAILSSIVQEQIEILILGVAQKTLNLSAIRQIKIPVPSIEEQNVFVSFVEQSDKSQFIEMFGDQKTNSLGLKSQTLGDICEFYSGTGFPNVYQGNMEGTYPFYKVRDISRNVQAGHTCLADCENYINDDVLKLIKGSIIPEGTVVFAKIGEALRLNRRAITVCDCLIDNNAMGIRPGAKLTLEYFFQYMKLLDMGEYAGATAMPSVKKSTLEAVQILVPDMCEQEQFSEMLRQSDKSKFYG